MFLTKSQLKTELYKWSITELVDYIVDKKIPIDLGDNSFFWNTMKEIEKFSEKFRNGFSHEKNILLDDHHFECVDINRNMMVGGAKEKRIAKILVLYTGGTIGMQRNEAGAYAPVSNAFLKRVRSYPELHNDYEFDKLNEQGCFLDNNTMVIPNVRNQVTAIYEIKEYDPLLDSSNMCSRHWVRIAKDIYKFYEHYDGFVILHGTDTLCYTASALSFLLQNLEKPVILTGSQIPIFETNSDAKSNFLNSIIFACVDKIQEVCICFANKLMRGNRTIKMSSNQLDAFSSPNFQNLGRVEMQLKVHNSLLLPRGNRISDLILYENLEANVNELRFTPMLTVEKLRDFLKPPTKGVILLSYGYGNIPSIMEETLKYAIKKYGVIIVNITQCNHGTIGNTYETSQSLEGIGVIAGYDMTSVAALVKLSYVLGRNDWNLDQKKNAMRENLCGEMTLPEDT